MDKIKKTAQNKLSDNQYQLLFEKTAQGFAYSKNFLNPQTVLVITDTCQQIRHLQQRQAWKTR